MVRTPRIGIFYAQLHPFPIQTHYPHGNWMSTQLVPIPELHPPVAETQYYCALSIIDFGALKKPYPVIESSFFWFALYPSIDLSNQLSLLLIAGPSWSSHWENLL